MEVLNIFSAFGLSASTGLNAYIPLLVVSLMARYTDLIKLGSPWDGMTSWWIIGTLIFLTVIEILADKIPEVNHINDIIQSVVRPAAGAIVFAASSSVVEYVHPVLALLAGLFISGGVNAVKSLVVRPAVTVTTAGAGNVPVSIAEDVTSTTVSVLSIIVPILAACLLVLIVVLVIIRVRRKRKQGKSQVLKPPEP